MQQLLCLALLAFFSVRSLPAQTLSSLSTPLSTISGERASISALGEGKVTVLVFWMTNCQPSRHELEALGTLSESMGDSVAVIAVAVDNTKTMAKVDPMARSRGYTFPVLLDPNHDLFDGLNGLEHPYTLIFNDQGILTLRWSGFLQGDETKLAAAIREALVGGDAAKTR